MSGSNSKVKKLLQSAQTSSLFEIKSKEKGYTPLHVAIMSGVKENVLQIVRKGTIDMLITKNKFGHNSFEMAECHPEIHSLLVEAYNAFKKTDTRQVSARFFEPADLYNRRCSYTIRSELNNVNCL